MYSSYAGVTYQPFPLLRFPPGKMSIYSSFPRKNEYILRFPPGKISIYQIFPPKKLGGKQGIYPDFPQNNIYTCLSPHIRTLQTLRIYQLIYYSIEFWMQKVILNNITLLRIFIFLVCFFKWSSFFTLHIVYMTLDLRTALL